MVIPGPPSGGKPQQYRECGICGAPVDPATADRTDDGPLYATLLACPDHAASPRFSDEAKAWAEAPIPGSSSPTTRDLFPKRHRGQFRTTPYQPPRRSA